MWFLNKIGYLYSRDGARLRTPAKRLQIAFWRPNSLRLVYAQHPNPFFRRSNPQNGANDGPPIVLSTDNPILFRNTPGIPRPVLRFHQLPDFAILHPLLFTCKTRGDTETDDISPQPSCGRSRTQLATCRLSCDHRQFHTVMRTHTTTVLRAHTVLRTRTGLLTHTANAYTHATAVLRSTSSFVELYEVLRSTPPQYMLRGREDTYVPYFFGKTRSSPKTGNLRLV